MSSTDVRTGDALVLRLIADAEARATAGAEAEALSLLRWASRVCTDALLPAVLLAYHRVRAMRSQPRAGAAAQVNVPAAAPAEMLGFPMPRFPTVPPTIDATSFVTGPRNAAPAVRRPVRTRAVAGEQAVRVGRDLRWVVVATAALGFAFATVVGQAGRISEMLADAGGGGADAVSATPATARPPGDMVARGRTLLASGDTAGALAVLDSAANAADADAEELRETARQLATIQGGEGLAADAYMKAVEAGMPSEYWGEAADALARAGRVAQADRLRALLHPRR